MTGYNALDCLVRTRLRSWPERPPGMGLRHNGRESWFRGRPGGRASLVAHPFLKLPGTGQMRTLPDGLWLNFGGTPVEPFVDIFAIEACGSLSNLLDKRSRFAPSTQSLLAVCPLAWLLSPAEHEQEPRWRAITQLRAKPDEPLALPVRDVRVMYGLKQRHYRFMQNHVPHPHEYFVPMETLTAEHGDRSPALHALLARACAAANFLTRPEESMA